MRITTELGKLGKLIKELREIRGITRNELAVRAGISVSHLEKIESGLRMPGMSAFLKIMPVLDVHINLHGTGTTIQEKCASNVQDIILNSTEEEARYLSKMVECMAENFVLIL